ncbi:MAG: efflux RND transporter periplasmic adaptor subunit [Ideonella sp.]|nr:efflux RND transporter periplasmic adaptor subunit [Ideonella sp.]
MRHASSLPRRALLGLAVSLLSPLGWAATTALATHTVQAQGSQAPQAFDGVVEAVRQTTLAAQVAGAVVQLDVKVGDRVAGGQVLLRLDARAADQATLAQEAQGFAAKAALDLAQQDLTRQRQLLQQQFISAAAFERAEAQFKASQAQWHAQVAQTQAARAQGGFYVLRAPFAGVVSELPASLGDMATPGRPLVTVYDPSSMRITAAIPKGLAGTSSVRLDVPGSTEAALTARTLQWLPAVDARSNTVQLRAELAASASNLAPGMFARVWVTAASAVKAASAATDTPARPSSLSVPLSAVVKRAEMTGVYVLDAQQRPLLRQVRLGPVSGSQVEVLSGLSVGERIALDPQAAARSR